MPVSSTRARKGSVTPRERDQVPVLYTHQKPFFVATNTCVVRGLSARRRLFNSTTFNNGCLGSRNDEERSEMRYLM